MLKAKERSLDCARRSSVKRTREQMENFAVRQKGKRETPGGDAQLDDSGSTERQKNGPVACQKETGKLRGTPKSTRKSLRQKGRLNRKLCHALHDKWQAFLHTKTPLMHVMGLSGADRKSPVPMEIPTPTTDGPSPWCQTHQECLRS